jgi:hypothetical protein
MINVYSIVSPLSKSNTNYVHPYWCEMKKAYNIYPCRHKQCLQNWKAIAKRRCKQKQGEVPANLKWWHVILHCNIPHLDSRFYNLEHFLEDVKHGHDDPLILVMKDHAGPYLHIHLGIALKRTTIDRALIRDRWKAHYPHPDKTTFNAQCVKIKRHHNPKELIRYYFFGSMKKPHQEPPWGLMRGRCCYWSKLKISND